MWMRCQLHLVTGIAECLEQPWRQLSSFASYVLDMGLVGAQALLDAGALPHGRDDSRARHGTRETQASFVQSIVFSLQFLFSNRQERCMDTSSLCLK